MTRLWELMMQDKLQLADILSNLYLLLPLGIASALAAVAIFGLQERLKAK
jgi:branched-subunit amino acid transport protein